MHFKNPNNLGLIMIFKRVFESTPTMVIHIFYPYFSTEFNKN